MKRLAIDFEHESRVWWNSGGQELWDGITDGFDEFSVVLDDFLAESWLTGAETIDGWRDGHENAPHPVRVSEVAEDEEVAR